MVEKSGREISFSEYDGRTFVWTRWGQVSRKMLGTIMHVLADYVSETRKN
ncbi:hypothetical protein WH47_07523 [Habropoda laboriosa]|uniref:Uncharacterized protein n=1 Tax=Habropoda laboriosa TaxID=597456 RepID=A0A0L7RG22_9HYME|nr:hypothetical protein WH47_07523 [Habropoda laboriosa]